MNGDLNYTVILSDKSERPVRAKSVTAAFIKMLNYLLTSGKNIDIEYIVDEKSKLIHYDFDWGVLFKDKDHDSAAGNPQKYTEEEIINIIESYANYVGNSRIGAEYWWENIGKKNI